MNSLGISALMLGLLQISVPSYALRLVRLCGTRRVGWFLVSAFSSLALLYLVMALKPAGAGSAAAFNIDLLAAVASLLLLIGMGHLETLFSYRRQSRLHARKRHAAWELRTREQTTEPARSSHDSLLEPARCTHCENALEDCEHRYRLLLELSEVRHGEAVRHLAGHVASQFNNALTLINSHTRLLLEKPQDATSAGHLRQLSVTAARAARLARQLLVVGNRYTLQREWLDLNALLAELRQTIGTLVAGRVVRETNYGLQLPPIWADARLVKHIIISLVASACDAMPRGGVLKIRTALVGAGVACAGRRRRAGAGEFVCLAITGTGADEVAQVSADPLPSRLGAMDAGGRKGLGLASVHEAARQLSGWVEVVAEARGGGEVKVFFPCAGSSVTKDALPPR